MVLPLWLPQLWPYLTCSTNHILFTIALIILFSVFAAILRIVSIRMNQSSCIRVNRPHLNAQAMQRLRNAFKFTLDENAIRTCNYQNGVKCILTSEKSFWLTHFWGVNITGIHKSLQAIPCNVMRQQLLEGNFLSDCSLLSSEPEIFHDTDQEVVYVVKPPRSFGEQDLGELPRTRYPLVVILLRNDEDDCEQPQETDVVCLVTIIHIEDSVVQKDTGILQQLLKLRNGQIFNLQQLFIPEAPDDDGNDCIICRSLPVSKAILPCRHACVCSTCFERIDICPVCRSDIVSFFNIGEQPPPPEPEAKENAEQAEETSWFGKVGNKIKSFF